MAEYRGRPYRTRRQSRGEPGADSVTFSLAAQTVIIAIMLLCVGFVKKTDEGKFLRFKAAYGEMIAQSEQAEGSPPGKGVLNGLAESTKDFFSGIFGGNEIRQYDDYLSPNAEDEPEDLPKNIPAENEVLSEADMVPDTTFKIPEMPLDPENDDAGDYLWEVRSAKNEKPGTLYMHAYADYGSSFSVEPIENTGGLISETLSYKPSLNESFIPPVSGLITSPFALRQHPITGKEHFHNALDIAAGKGGDIMAALSGTVESVGESETYGNYIVLRHSEQLETLYSHCSEIMAKQGMAVKQGERIAKVGDTGLTTGPHLHFSVRVNGEYTDPAKFLNQYISVLE